MSEIYTKLNNMKVDAVLDIATGNGAFLEHLCSLFSDYGRAIGIDTNEKAVRTAGEREKDKRISFLVMDAGSIDFEDGHFDVVSISNSIHHFRERERILAEALRVLKPGGLFIVSEMFHSGEERPSQSTHSDFHHWWGEIDSALGNFHGMTYTREELLSIVRSLPLSEIEYDQDDGSDEDIYSDDVKKQLTGAFEMYRDKTKDLDDRELYIKRGEELLEKLNRDGFAPASRLEFICRK